ncbi:U11/U12 small nuclear ribonucleoprotein 25 kDa protein-like [Varroa jacobsoni]|uniref:U11/U12 small nuclear ribonucleoprotein 25 kDa protein-like n=1 Tax=Varroa jacobsoni TaxID=62625 RepID=UPI000BF73E67|nr:U11/U12 small nuclear ribonucleoprotein 25 kDa protein-like [Varroa jacobsoni]
MNRDKIMAELKQLDKKMFNLVKSDNLLSGLETSSLERIQQLIDAETGQKIRIFIVRDDGKRLDVVVSPDASILELRRAVELATEDYYLRSTCPDNPCFPKPRISWKQFWGHHTLVAHDVRIDEVDCSIREYNITSGTVLKFAKRLRIRAAATVNQTRDFLTDQPSTSSSQGHRFHAYEAYRASKK